MTDLGADLAQHYAVEGLVQADVERRRLRAARCNSPLLTPSTLSAAWTDARLGSRWVDELLDDCPQFSAFLSDLAMRRARESGVAMHPPVAPPASAEPERVLPAPAF